MTAPDDPAPDDAVVDARGLRCPLPVIRLATVARGRPDGSRLTVWSTDPAAVHDVPAWARMLGHTIESSIEVRAVGGTYRAVTVVLGTAKGPDAVASDP